MRVRIVIVGTSVCVRASVFCTLTSGLDLQALAGKDLVDKTIATLCSNLGLVDRSGLVLLDIFGYDGWGVESAIVSNDSGLYI